MPQNFEKKPTIVHELLKRLPTFLVLATIGGGWLLIHYINEGSHTEDASTEVESSPTDVLELPEGKLRSGNFSSSPVESRAIQHFHVVPGRLRYDQTKHVNIKAPMDGILSELLVTPGQHVAAGSLLAVLRSPEVGQARAEILKCSRELALAQQVSERERTLTENFARFSAMLDQSLPASEIEASLENLALGSYRQEVLNAYAKMSLADELITNVRPLVESGAVAGRLVRERETERQVAETEFRTARDQAAFALKQAEMKAEAAVSEAERQLNLAWQSLEALLGHEAVDRSLNGLDDDESLSRLEVRAPFAGTVESQSYAKNERLMRGDTLVVLANTESLFVEADIRESDWAAIAIETGSEVTVKVPALGNRDFPAQVRYFGREVQADTNAIPLVALIENAAGLLRPGMFVRVTVPIGEKRNALSVKADSVLQHENRQFVFVDMQEGKFKKVDVSTGQVLDDWIEITSGLEAGQMVVRDGAFLLKSEYLLQGEGD